jgi:hypothetical protein
VKTAKFAARAPIRGGWHLAVTVACRTGRTACSALELLAIASTVRLAHVRAQVVGGHMISCDPS